MKKILQDNKLNVEVKKSSDNYNDLMSLMGLQRKELLTDESASREIDLSLLDNFSEKSEIFEAFSAYMPNKFKIGEKSCSLDVLKNEGVFETLVFQAINKLFTGFLNKKEPFEGVLEKTNDVALLLHAFEFISLNPDNNEIIELLAPIVMKNFYLFEEKDLFYQNRKKIKFMALTGNFFVNKDGDFVTYQSFIAESESEFAKLPINIFGANNSLRVKNLAKRIREINEDLNALEGLKTSLGIIGKDRETLIPPSIKEKLDYNKKYEGSKVRIISQEDLEFINDTVLEGEPDDVSHKKIKILSNNEHIKEGIPLSVADKSMLSALEELKERFPNFKEVVEYIEGSIYISLLKPDSEVHFEPILLLGSPGLGKTGFSINLSKALKTKGDVWSAPQFNQGFSISGLDLGWASGKVGKVFTTLAKNNIANPIIFIDELDKLQDGVSGGGNVSSLLLQLFERDTASGFVDEALDVPINASYINWICAANDINEIPQALLSRMKVFNISKPTSRMMPTITKSIYANLLEEELNGSCFVEELPSSFYNQLSEYEPRKVRKILQDCMRYAAQKAVKANNLGAKIVLDEMSLVKALRLEPSQKQRNLKST